MSHYDITTALFHKDQDQLNTLIKEDTSRFIYLDGNGQSYVHAFCMNNLNHSLNYLVDMLKEHPKLANLVTWTDNFGISPSSDCCYSDNHDCLRILSQLQCVRESWIQDPVKNNESLVHICCKQGSIKCLNHLMDLPEGRYFIDKMDNYGRTPLINTIWYKKYNCTKKLLEIPDGRETIIIPTKCFKDTVLHMLCNDLSDTSYEILLLLRQRYNTFMTLANMKNINNETIIFTAFKYSNLRFARILLEYDEYIETLKLHNKFGETVLHMACANNNPEAIKLIKQHTNINDMINAKSMGSMSPMDIVIKNNYQDCLNLLQ